MSMFFLGLHVRRFRACMLQYYGMLQYPITNRADTMPARAPNLGLRFVSLETVCVGHRVRRDVSLRDRTR